VLGQQLAVCGSAPQSLEIIRLVRFQGALIGLDLNLLHLLGDLQFVRRQHRARALAVRREDQLDCTDAVAPGTRTSVQLAEGKNAIGDETESSPVLRGQFDDALDLIAHTSTSESDSTLGLHVLEDIDQAVLTRACERIASQNLFAK